MRYQGKHWKMRATFDGVVAALTEPFGWYVLAIYAANWAIQAAGPDGIPVGFGLRAPGGVLFAGLVFTFRNLTQLRYGRRAGFLAIGAGAVLSAFLAPGVSLGGPLPLPLASALSFGLAEAVDAGFWTYLREHKGWWTRAMFLGDLAGQVADSAIFLALAFGSWEFLLGQIVGKQWTIWPALFLMAYVREGRGLSVPQYVGRKLYVTLLRARYGVWEYPSDIGENSAGG